MKTHTPIDLSLDQRLLVLRQSHRASKALASEMTRNKPDLHAMNGLLEQGALIADGQWSQVMATGNPIFFQKALKQHEIVGLKVPDTVALSIASAGSVAFMKALAQQGFNLNATLDARALTDSDYPKDTVLGVAAAAGHADLVNWLLQNGADPNLAPKNKTVDRRAPPPLHRVINRATAEHLIKAGADVQGTDQKGRGAIETFLQKSPGRLVAQLAAVDGNAFVKPGDLKKFVLEAMQPISSVLSCLLEHGAPVRRYDGTSCVWSALNAAIEPLQFDIKHTGKFNTQGLSFYSGPVLATLAEHQVTWEPTDPIPSTPIIACRWATHKVAVDWDGQSQRFLTHWIDSFGTPLYWNSEDFSWSELLKHGLNLNARHPTTGELPYTHAFRLAFQEANALEAEGGNLDDEDVLRRLKLPRLIQVMTRGRHAGQAGMPTPSSFKTWEQLRVACEYKQGVPWAVYLDAPAAISDIRQTFDVLAAEEQAFCLTQAMASNQAAQPGNRKKPRL